MYAMTLAVLGAAATASAAGLAGPRYPNVTTPAAVYTTEYTTEVVTAYTTYCPLPTTVTLNNKTYTVTEATTLTITNCPCTIHKPVPVEDDCVKRCILEYNVCRIARDANRAYCASKFAACVGYNPWWGGSYVTPTACATRARPTGTGILPTETVVLPTETGVPPTETGVQPTETGVQPTETGVQPTETGVQTTETPGEPTETETGTPPPFTAGAGQMNPQAAMALLAFGAFALL